MTDIATDRDIESTLKDIIVTMLGNPVEHIGTDTELTALPGIESITVLRIVTRIEQRYDIELQDTVVFQIKTFGELCGMVRGEVAGKASPGELSALSARDSRGSARPTGPARAGRSAGQST
jgi:acyl carrier protein